MFGAMGTFASRPDAFGDQEIALVRALADHAAAAMANADLIKQLGRSRADIERRADTERALREIGGRIIGLRHPEEVLQLSVDEAARLLDADGARIDVLDEATGGLYWAYDATTGRRPGLGPIAGTGEAKAGEGISGKAVREHEAVFTGDYLERRPLRARLGPRRPRPALPDPVGRRGPADRRSRTARDADRLHRRAGRVRRGRRPDHRGARRPGRYRDDERPPHRGAGPRRGAVEPARPTRSGRSARSPPGSPRSATRATCSSTSSTRPPACSAPSASGST